MLSLALFLIIYPFTTNALSWQRLYNCNSMTSEVFPVPKLAMNYGPKPHQLRGEWWDEAQAKRLSYWEKVHQALDLALSEIPQDRTKAFAAFDELKNKIYERENKPELALSSDDFNEKINLTAFRSSLGGDVIEAFPFIEGENSVEWLDYIYKLFGNWDGLIDRYYHNAALRRPIKADYTDKDYCFELANSFEKSPADWASGNAKDAFKLVFRCFDTFPHSAEAVDELIDVALMLNDLFVFSNISSPHVGTTKFFQFLKKQQIQFDSNFRWHEFLPGAVNVFKDAHCSVKADCYGGFTYIQPIFLQKIHRDGNDCLILTKSNSLELNNWINAEVISIDGNKADNVIDRYASMTGKCHDSRARSTFVLSRKQWGVQDFKLERGLYLKRTSLPTRPFVVYSLKRQNSDFIYEIKVNWMIFKADTLVGFNNQYSYWKNNCGAKPFVKKQTPVLTKRTIPNNNHAISSPQNAAIPSLVKRDITYQTTNEGITPIVIGPGFAFFTLVDDDLGTFGVLAIQSFDVTDLEGWFRGMRAGFQKLIQTGTKKLLLDLSGNTGGVLCLAYSLLGVLSPSPTYPFPATKYAYGTRANPSELLDTFSKCVDEANLKGSPFKLQTFKNLTCNCDFAPNVGWKTDMDTEINLVNGFFQGYSKYSTFLLDRCDLKYSPLLEDIKPDFDNIIVLSDGLCGSSCAIVSLYLQQNGSPGIAIATSFSPFTIAEKGITTIYPIGLFSFAGGQVVSYDNLKDVAKRSSCYNLVPKVLERVQITFTYRAIFNLKDKTNPLEYYIIPANATLDYTDELTNSISERWKKAFPLGMDVLKNPDFYPRYEKSIITRSTRFSFIDMNVY